MTGFNPVLATVSILVGTLGTLAVIFGVAIALLAAGDLGDPPGKCRNSAIDLESVISPGLRDALTDPKLAEQFQRRWDEFEAQLNAGSPAAVTFEEGEITSRVAQWIDDTGAPLEDVTICIYDSKAQARGHAKIPYLADIPLLGGLYETDIRLLGRIDLVGDHPEIMIIEMDAGDIPDWAMGPIQDDLTEIINSRLETYDIDHTYTVTYRERQLEISGQP